jgi:hypothetical protein
MNIIKEYLFIATPPYLETTNNYKINWNISDLIDLITILKDYEKKGSNFIISERECKEINEIAKEFKLNIFEVKKVKHLNRIEKNEIILTNIQRPYLNGSLF